MSVTLRSVQYTSDGVVKTVVPDQHVGLVLARFHQETRVMSDIWERLPYALIWNAKDNRADRIHIEFIEDATVDATPEVIEAYRASVASRYIEREKQKRIEMQSQPKIGSMVKVVSGRNNKNTIGKVTYIKDMPYQMGYRSAALPKLCIALSDDKVTMTGRYGRSYDRYTNVAWVWARNVKVLNSEVISADSLRYIEAQAKEFADAGVERLKHTYFGEHQVFN